MRVKCRWCCLDGTRGNSIRYRNIHIGDKTLKVLIHDHCFEEIETRRREKQ